MKTLKPILVVAALSAPFGIAQVAGAEEPETEARAWGDVVVTARGREEQAQSVPDTVNSFSGLQIDQRQVRLIDDIVALTPGVFMVNDQDPGTNLITIRGVSTNRQQVASIAYAIDGVLLGDTEFFTGRLFDVERVEVLKGPQGALYGRSAIGGVFKVTTRAPTDDFEGYARIGYGNGDSWEAEAAIGGPIIENKLLFRVSALASDTNGFIFNTFLGKKVDGYESNNLRARIIALPSDNLSIDFRFNYMDEEGGAAFVSSNNVTGFAGGRLSGDVLTDPFGDFEGMADRDWINASVKIDWTLGDGGVLTSITAYDDYDKFFIEELDFRNDTPITFFGVPSFPNGIQPIAQPIGLEVFTQELRYTSSSDQRLRWIFGLFYQDVSRDRTDDFGPLLFGAEAPLIATDSKVFAVFAQASYDITDALEITLALRYDRDKRSEVTTGVTTGAVFGDRSASFDKVQPKVSLAWQATDDALLYATFAQGFKAGGFNVPPGALDTHEAIFPSETTLAVEVGAKTQWLDDRVIANLALFYTDYENFQNTIFVNGNNTVFSVDNVEVKGIELSLLGRLTEGFSVEAAFAYTDSQIKTYTAPDPLGSGAFIDYSGNTTPHSPKYTVNLAAQYETQIGNTAELFMRVDYIHVGRVNYEFDNVLHSPSHGWVNARIALTVGNVELALWAKNLTNERWAISAFGQGQIALLAFLGPDGPFDSFTINRGRQWGGTITARF